MISRTSNKRCTSNTRSMELLKVFGERLHFKRFAIVKQILVLLYVLRSIHVDLNMHLYCYVATKAVIGSTTNLKICVRASCLWLNWIVLRLPQWIVHDLSGAFCTALLYFVLLSSVLMLGAFYTSEMEKNSSWFAPRWLRIVMSAPSVFVEVLFAVLVFSGIVVTTWSLQKLNISSISFILAVLSVIILALFIVAEIVLHIATVIYICRRYDFKRTMNVQDIDFAVKSEVNDTLTATLPAKLKCKHDYMSLLSSVEDSSKFSRISRQGPGYRKSLLESFDLPLTYNNRPVPSHNKLISSNKRIPISSSNYAPLHSSFVSSADRTYLSDYDVLQSVFRPNDSNRLDRSSNFDTMAYAVPSTCPRR